MRIHFARLGKVAATMVAFSGFAVAGDRIVPVRENGRVVFVNEEGSPVQTIARPANSCDPSSSQQYVYWSNTQRKWKRAPAASTAAGRNACSAAHEVTAALSVASIFDAGMVLTRGTRWTPTTVDGLIEETARRHEVDPNLVRAIIKVESNFDSRAVSRKGAMGLMQLMPSTARELKVHNPYDPAQNLDGGIRHIKALLEQNNGDVALSLAAYNAGQRAVNRHRGVPNYRETRSYVRRITEMYADGRPLTGAISNRSLIRVSKDSDGHRLYTND